MLTEVWNKVLVGTILPFTVTRDVAGGTPTRITSIPIIEAKLLFIYFSGSGRLLIFCLSNVSLFLYELSRLFASVMSCVKSHNAVPVSFNPRLSIS